MSGSESSQHGENSLRAPAGNTMALLQSLVEHSSDDDYYGVPERTAGGPHRARWATAAALVAFALLLSVAAVQTRVNRPEAATERAALIEQINNQKSTARDKQDAATKLSSDVADLRARRPDASARQQLEEEQLVTGAIAVHGPGLQIVVDNAADPARGNQGRVLDTDLQLLVNGLWLAGAEAIAINGNRLTTLSSIRTAGEAITVNYKSLTRPYTINAIGNPDTLQARFLETAAGQSWNNLRTNFGLTFKAHSKKDLQLPAAPKKRSKVRLAESTGVNP